MPALIVRDACLAAGTAMVAAGAWMLWGAAVCLLVTGALVIGLTAYTFRGA